jgi:hypothetical protein
MSQAKVMENSSAKAQKKPLFGILGHVLVVSKQKFDMERASNKERQAWGRLIVAAVEAYGKLLQTQQLDDLEQRIEVLEGVKKKIE